MGAVVLSLARAYHQPKIVENGTNVSGGELGVCSRTHSRGRLPGACSRVNERPPSPPACPTCESLIPFEAPTTGVVRDVHGTVLIELAREYRQVVTYDEVPLILRQAIMAAEDNRFFDHSGVDYRALPRVVQEDRGALTGGMVEGRPRVAAAPAARGFDAHPATRQRLLPAGHDEPHRSRCALPRGSGPAPAPSSSWAPAPERTLLGRWRRCA